MKNDNIVIPQNVFEREAREGGRHMSDNIVNIIFIGYFLFSHKKHFFDYI